MNSLLAVTPYGRSGASSRVRVLDWLRHLSIDAEICDYLGTANHSSSTLYHHAGQIPGVERKIRLLAKSVKSRTVLLSRNVSPFSNGKLEAQFLRNSSLGVYDFDDALWAAPSSGVRAMFSKKRIWKRSVEAADYVIAGSEYLMEHAAPLNSNVVFIPSCVEPSDYQEKQSYALEEAPRLVWLGSMSTEIHLTHIQQALLYLHKQRGVQITVISGEGSSLGPLDEIVTRVRWDARTVGEHLAIADLALAPLEDNEFARGKCAYKVLQYAAAALPIVGSPIGANRKVLADMRGLAVTGTDEWVSAIEQILDEGACARAKRGRAAREHVKNSYSYASWARKWSACLRLNPDLNDR